MVQYRVVITKRIWCEWALIKTRGISFLCGSRVAKHFVISRVFAKLRLQYGYECERSNANNYEPKLDKKDK